MVTTAVAAVSGAVPPPRKAKAVTVATTPPPTLTRRQLLAAVATASTLRTAAASAAAPRFAEIPGSGGVKALDLREGSGEIPAVGDQVAIHYYGRLAAKQGWRFDSTYDHKDETGDPMPFVFTLGSGKVIPGVEAAVKSMRVGGLRRVIIPPSQGYQNTSQEPIPPRRRARRREPENFIPRRSDRLAAKSVFRDPNPEKQAKRVLVNKWEGRPDDAVTNTPDEGIALKFHAAFGGPVSPRKREYMRMLFHGTRQYEPEELEY